MYLLRSRSSNFGKVTANPEGLRTLNVVIIGVVIAARPQKGSPMIFGYYKE
jgi:hypothetical protein